MDPRLEYLSTKVTPLLEPLIIDLMIQQPAQPIEFIYQWISHKYKEKKEEVKEKPKIVPRKEESGSEHSFESEEEDDIVDDLPIKRSTGVIRKSISAEAFGIYNKKENFVARTIPKTEEQKKKIRSKLLASFLFSSLEAKDLEVVIGAMEEKQFNAGTQVIKQGEEGDNLYVVDDGNLTCTKQFNKDEEPKFLKEYKPGEAFGELALLYNAPRAANIVAKSNCTLWCLDRNTFVNIVKEAAMKKREKYESFLRSVEILAPVEPYEITGIVDAVKPVEYAKGDYIIREGTEGNIFYFLESGEATALKAIESGQPAKAVMEYKKGSYFGELALLRNAPRAASIVAKTDCVCLSLDRHSFKRLLGPLDELLKRNTEIYNQYMRKLK